MLTRPFFLIFCLVSTFHIVGCETTPHRSERGPERTRNSQQAAQLTSQAVVLLQENPDSAERLLRQALQSDLFHGPAHNNLGVLHLNRGELYQAAEEFDWARRLMPGHPDPRINLGIALERGGKIKEALDAYESALEAYPDHLPAMQALARCQIRHAEYNELTKQMLQDIVFRSDPEWRDWAKKQLGTRDW